MTLMINKVGLPQIITPKRWLKSTQLMLSKKKLNNQLKIKYSKGKKISNKLNNKNNFPSLWSVLILPSKTYPLTWESNLSHLMVESSLQSEDSSGNVTFVGNSLMLSKIKSNFAPAVDTTVFPRFHTQWTWMVTSFFTEKKVGNPIRKYKNGSRKSSNNNKEKRNINTKDVKKVIFIFNSEQSIFDTVWS